MRSLCTPMKAEGLTTLKIRYDWKKDQFWMEAMKQWEQDLDFSKYNKEFYVESILTEDVVYLNTKQVRALYKKYDLEDYLDEILDLIRQGRHFGIECYYNDKYNIRFMCHQHSRKLGVNNRLHATLAGGIRRHDVNEDEKEVIIDGLNLGRGMSFKNVAGNLAFGGCKTTVQMEELDLSNLEIMGFLGFAIDNCRTMTGPDMNFPTEMADVENANGRNGKTDSLWGLCDHEAGRQIQGRNRQSGRKDHHVDRSRRRGLVLGRISAAGKRQALHSGLESGNCTEIYRRKSWQRHRNRIPG